MPRGPGKDTWAHGWFDKDELCRHVSSTGVRCERTVRARYVNVRAEHLKVHGVTNATPLPKPGGTPTLEEAWANQRPKLDKEDTALVFLAENGLSNRIMASESFRELTGLKFGKNGITRKLMELNEKLQKAALGYMTRATLAIDIGTVHNRYLAFVLVRNGRALFYKMVSSSDPRVGGSFTAQVMRRVLEDIIEELAGKGVNINAVVADNAANMQAIRNRSTDEELLQDDEPAEQDEPADCAELRRAFPALFRCACHVLQLAVRDVASVWEPAFEIAQAALRTAGVRLTANDTRWNSKYRVILKASDLPGLAGSESREIEEALKVLEPFAIATDVLQRDAASTFDAMIAFESLERWFEHLRDSCPASPVGSALALNYEAARAAVQTRAAMIFNEPYLVLAYFAPSNDRGTPESCAVAPLVETLLQSLGVEPAELARIQTLIVDPVQGPVRAEDYRAHIGKHYRVTPKLFKILAGWLDAAPSEASVERLFSALKFGFNPWRNRASPELVNAALGVAAAFRFFRPTGAEIEAEEAAVAALSPSPRNPRRHMSEDASGTASPAATQPFVDVDGETDDAAAPEPEERFELAACVTNTFEVIVDRFAAQIRPEAPAPTRPKRALRSLIDKCVDCGKPCEKHEFAAYMECAKCKCRRACSHASANYRTAAYKEHKLFIAVNGLPLQWMCKVCRDE